MGLFDDNGRPVRASKQGVCPVPGCGQETFGSVAVTARKGRHGGKTGPSFTRSINLCERHQEVAFDTLVETLEEMVSKEVTT